MEILRAGHLDPWIQVQRALGMVQAQHIQDSKVLTKNHTLKVHKGDSHL